MKMPLRQDLRAQSELLAYLVISQLVSKHATGDWMSVADTAGSIHMWLNSGKGDDDLIRTVNHVRRKSAPRFRFGGGS
jgi:hypothetical protein